MNKAKQNLYYHYTSLESLYKIIINKNIRLSYLNYTNDKNELEDDILLIIKILYEIQKDEKNLENKELIKKYIDIMNNFSIFKDLNKIDYYGLSLTANKDNLLHWEKYGNHNKGVCIGINLDKIINSYCIYGNFSLLEKNTIYYSVEEKINSFRKFIISHLPYIVNKKDNEKFIFDFLISLVYSQKVFCKRENFANENEIRLILSPKVVLFSTDNDRTANEAYNFAINSHNLDKVKYDLIHGEIQPFKELDISKLLCNNVFPEIILGPLCPQNRNNLIKFLEENEMDITEVSKSNIEIRD